MCLRPKFIYVARDRTSFTKQQIYRSVIHSCGDPAIMNKIEPYFMNKVQVPCNNCVECLKQRQNDLASRVSMAASEYHSMHFVTLTYDEENLPLTARLAFVNKDTGEVILDSAPIQLVRTGRDDNKVFPWQLIFDFHWKIEHMRISKEPRVITYEYGSDDKNPSWLKYYFITPSLHRRDVRLWFKSARVAYEREKGEKLPDFKYVLSGEFGPKTSRPHYHLILLGLNDSQVRFMVDRWKYGFKQIKKIPELNKDGSNGYVLAAKYVSKYICKGEFECSSVKSGYAERPRICLSRYVGTVIDPDLLPYLRCYDLFGEYDLDTLIIKGTEHDDCPKRLSVDQIAQILNEYRKRSIRRYSLSSWTTLPKCLFKKVFSCYYDYVDLRYEKTIKKARRSVIQMAFGTFVESDFLADFVAKLRKVEGIMDKDIFLQTSSFIKGQQAIRDVKEEVGKKNLRSFYAKSIY